MVTFANGAVILVRFPFSDLSDAKLRPAIVLADAGRGDKILCQVTSRSYADSTAIEINDVDFESGSLLKTSYARPSKLFTANAAIMTRRVGDLESGKFAEIIKAIVSLLEKSV